MNCNTDELKEFEAQLIKEKTPVFLNYIDGFKDIVPKLQVYQAKLLSMLDHVSLETKADLVKEWHIAENYRIDIIKEIEKIYQMLGIEKTSNGEDLV